MANRAPIAVLLRKGPSNWVQMIRWDLNKDSFEEGQWLKGRVYAERSELSDDGELLLYSARKGGWQTRHRSDIGNTWTAVSRPPFFTALALWSNDCWDGGGIFDGLRSVVLDLNYPKPHPHLEAPRLSVEGCRSSQTLPLSLRIALRAGWQPLDLPLEQLTGYHWQIKTRIGKEIGAGAARITCHYWHGRHLRGHQRFTFSNVHGDHDLGEMDLLDFDQKGRLVKSAGGQLLICENPSAATLYWRQLADFSQSRPTPLPPKDWAREWPPVMTQEQ